MPLMFSTVGRWPAAFAAMIRVLVVALPHWRDDWRPAIWVLAVLSLVVGSVLAVTQTNVKRMLAYSSISHAGFILLGVEAASHTGSADASDGIAHVGPAPHRGVRTNREDLVAGGDVRTARGRAHRVVEHDLAPVLIDGPLRCLEHVRQAARRRGAKDLRDTVLGGIDVHDIGGIQPIGLDLGGGHRVFFGLVAKSLEQLGGALGVQRVVARRRVGGHLHQGL